MNTYTTNSLAGIGKSVTGKKMLFKYRLNIFLFCLFNIIRSGIFVIFDLKKVLKSSIYVTFRTFFKYFGLPPKLYLKMLRKEIFVLKLYLKYYIGINVELAPCVEQVRKPIEIQRLELLEIFTEFSQEMKTILLKYYHKLQFNFCIKQEVLNLKLLISGSLHLAVNSPFADTPNCATLYVQPWCTPCTMHGVFENWGGIAMW